ncbi:MAG: hypothetical protein FWE38_00190 [Firmicutes bacterium]|nr:hypothetical protein [Bacillota bacterium]
MNKIIKLIVDDYLNQKPSAEYRLAQKEVCEAQAKFMTGLNKKQRKEFFKLDSIQGKLNVIEDDECAEFLFKRLFRNSTENLDSMINLDLPSNSTNLLNA